MNFKLKKDAISSKNEKRLNVGSVLHKFLLDASYSNLNDKGVVIAVGDGIAKFRSTNLFKGFRYLSLATGWVLFISSVYYTTHAEFLEIVSDNPVLVWGAKDTTFGFFLVWGALMGLSTLRVYTLEIGAAVSPFLRLPLRLIQVLMGGLFSINLESIQKFWSTGGLYIFNKDFCVFFKKNGEIFRKFVEFKEPGLYQECLSHNVVIEGEFNGSYTTSLQKLQKFDWSWYDSMSEEVPGTIVPWYQRSLAATVGEAPLWLALVVVTTGLVAIAGYVYTVNSNISELYELSEDNYYNILQNDQDIGQIRPIVFGFNAFVSKVKRFLELDRRFEDPED